MHNKRRKLIISETSVFIDIRDVLTAPTHSQVPITTACMHARAVLHAALSVGLKRNVNSSDC